MVDKFNQQEACIQKHKIIKFRMCEKIAAVLSIPLAKTKLTWERKKKIENRIRIEEEVCDVVTQLTLRNCIFEEREKQNSILEERISFYFQSSIWFQCKH